MSRYARIENELVVEVRDMADNFDPDEVRHKYDLRIVNQLPDPVFDPETEILVTPASELTSWDFVVNPTDVDATRLVRPLTQEELDAYEEELVTIRPDVLDCVKQAVPVGDGQCCSGNESPNIETRIEGQQGPGLQAKVLGNL